jgi:hypothetical protein
LFIRNSEICFESFNSYEFLGFLPIVFVGFVKPHVAAQEQRDGRVGVALSMAIEYQSVPCCSARYASTTFFARLIPSDTNDEKTRRVFLYISVGLNLLLLALSSMRISSSWGQCCAEGRIAHQIGA